MKKIIVSISILILSCALFAQKKSTATSDIDIKSSKEHVFVIDGEKLSLGQVIDLVVKNNFGASQAEYDYVTSDSDLQKFKTKYTTYLNAEAGLKKSDYPDTMQSQYGLQQNQTSAGVSILQMLPTGTTLSAGFTHNYTETIDQTSYFAPGEFDSEGYNSVLYLSVQQEFLKNFLGYDERNTARILANKSAIQKLYVEYQVMGLVVQSIVDYWTVALNKTTLDNAKRKLTETRKLRNIIAQNVRLGLAENYDLNYYNLLVASSESSVAVAQQTYNDSIRTLLRHLNMPKETKISDVMIINEKYDEIKEEEILKLAYERRADYKNAKLSLDIQKRQLSIFKSEDLPSLTGELTVSSLGYDEEMGEAYGDTFGLKNKSIEAKLKLSYPLGNSEAKVSKRDAKLNYEKAKKDLETVEREVRDDIASKIENIETSYYLYQKAAQARRQAQIYYTRLVRNLRRGRLTAAVVKQGLDALIDSRQGELQALVGYNIAVLQLRVATNTLFKEYNIKVESYIPK